MAGPFVALAGWGLSADAHHIAAPDLGGTVDRSPPTEFERLELEIALPPGEHLVYFDATPKPVGLARMYCAWTATDVRLEVGD